jgi:hypothetical protein
MRTPALEAHGRGVAVLISNRDYLHTYASKFEILVKPKADTQAPTPVQTTGIPKHHKTHLRRSLLAQAPLWLAKLHQAFMLGIATSTPLSISNSKQISGLHMENDGAASHMSVDSRESAAPGPRIASIPHSDRHALNYGGGEMGR